MNKRTLVLLTVLGFLTALFISLNLTKIKICSHVLQGKSVIYKFDVLNKSIKPQTDTWAIVGNNIIMDGDEEFQFIPYKNHREVEDDRF